MKVQRISYWLKGIVILIAVMGALFFGGMTWAIVQQNLPLELVAELTQAAMLPWTILICMWYTAICCYIVLIEFWKVCTQIGNDNSFSTENAVCFRRMAQCGGAAAAGFLVRLFLISLCVKLQLMAIVIIVFEILASLIFLVLCEALSRLILNAYEVKMENELTI